MLRKLMAWRERRKADPVWASLRFLGFMMGMMWVLLVFLLIDRIKADWGIR